MSITFIRELQVNYSTTNKEITTQLLEPELVAQFLRSVLPTNVQECVLAVYLSSCLKPLAYKVVSIGTNDACMFEPSDIIRPALLCGATKLIVAHNHPSGNIQPSAADKKVTTRLKEACSLLGLTLLDHIIIADNSDFYSFNTSGLLI